MLRRASFLDDGKAVPFLASCRYLWGMNAVNKALNIFVVVFLVMSGLTASAESQFPSLRYNLGCSTGDCLVSSWERGGEEPEFLYLGRPLSDDRQVLPTVSKWRFRSAMARFPTAQHCLLESPASPNGYDLLQFNWDAQRNSEILAVCLARVHNAISDPSISVQWFEALGFSTFVVVKPIGHFREGETVIHLTWHGDEGTFPAKRVSPLITRLLFGAGFSMGVRISKDYRVQHVSITVNIL
ncbi:MAG: hypothetical protein ABJQ34_16165 [Paracoccaceae bacterium]